MPENNRPTVSTSEKRKEPLTCFIPSRKGSRRFPDKSKQLINGKPIIWYTIKAAQKSRLFTDIIVTSDDMETLAIAYDLGARLHLRPSSLAGNNIQLRHVIRSMANMLNVGDCMCLMPPCNPFVTARDLWGGYQLFRDKNANYVMSVVKSIVPMERMFHLDKGMIPPKLNTPRAQKCKPTYYADGSFIFIKTKAFMVEFDFGFYGTACYPYVIEHPSVDIDTKDDYEYAKFLMERK